MNGKPFEHHRCRPGRGGARGRAVGGRGGARAGPARRRHADRQGLRGRGRRQHPLDAGLYAHGGTRPGRAELRARHAGGDAVPGRRELLRAPRPRCARDGAMDRRARRRVPPADLLSRQGPAAHPAGRRRRDRSSASSRAPRRTRALCSATAARRKGSSARVAAIRGVRSPAARSLPPTPWCSPAAASRATAAMMREHFGPGGEGIPLLAPGARFNTGDGIAMALRARRGRRRRVERHAHRAGRPAQHELRAGRPALSLRHRGGPERPPLLRRGRRPRARDLGVVLAPHPFRGRGPRGLRDPR